MSFVQKTGGVIPDHVIETGMAKIDLHSFWFLKETKSAECIISHYVSKWFEKQMLQIHKGYQYQ